jgi:hypothetical protein
MFPKEIHEDFIGVYVTDFIYRIVGPSLRPRIKKNQSMQWKHPGLPPPKKFKRLASAGKMMASIFWDRQGIIMIDYFEKDRTINDTYYADKWRRLRQEIARKRWDKLTKGVLLLHENTLAHTSQVAMAATTNCGFEIFLTPHILRTWPPLTFFTSFRN